MRGGACRFGSVDREIAYDMWTVVAGFEPDLVEQKKFISRLQDDERDVLNYLIQEH